MASVSPPLGKDPQSAVAIPGTSGKVPEQEWPSPARAWTCVGFLAFAHMINMFDAGLTGFLIELIKADFQATDFQMSLLTGVAPVLFYALIGLPMARLIDRYPRTIVMPIGSIFVGVFTVMCGLAQNFWHLFVGRMFVGSSATVNGPGFYSLLADYFPPHKLSRAIAGMQVGFVLGTALASVLGGLLVAAAIGWGTSEWFGLTIKPWHKVYLIGAIGAFVVALILWCIKEPDRREIALPVEGQKPKMLPVSDVMKELWARRGVYAPLFVALAIVSIEGTAIAQWRIPFLQRTYGWDVAMIGLWQGGTMLIFSLVGLPLGAWLTETLQKRYDDAPVRAVMVAWVCALPFAVASPLMPTGELSIILAGVSISFSMAAAVPQNTAIQVITPNRMRAQVTALYMFMFTVVGGLGPTILTLISGMLGGEAYLGPAMAIAVGVMMPVAIYIIYLGLRPYAREIAGRKEAGLI
ncbi:MFS transporter [Altericroceibacterium endophyticum]|uniref:MFS transporter n=1 Tax=Altericroceibacterium endophyticum TaxID=1808508 RepID=A0A6I4T0D5_9SPHN|nr:MFS transporter [Altericroceibacterium endophyticum]MXO64407.1 MFS transporter [Altericroceibacterium endophyticum]